MNTADIPPLAGEAAFGPARPKPHALKACASTIPPFSGSLNGTFVRFLDANRVLGPSMVLMRLPRVSVHHDNNC